MSMLGFTSNNYCFSTAVTAPSIAGLQSTQEQPRLSQAHDQAPTSPVQNQRSSCPLCTCRLKTGEKHFTGDGNSCTCVQPFKHCTLRSHARAKVGVISALIPGKTSSSSGPAFTTVMQLTCHRRVCRQRPVSSTGHIPLS